MAIVTADTTPAHQIKDLISLLLIKSYFYIQIAAWSDAGCKDRKAKIKITFRNFLSKLTKDLKIIKKYDIIFI